MLTLDDLAPTDNSLKDIIRWLQDGYCVTIHANGERAQRYCNKPDECKGLVNLNVAPYSELLDDGEWEWYIKDSGCQAYATLPPVPPSSTINFSFF